MIPKSVPLYGLILAGGYSQRMGRDKALLNYHGKPQVDVCVDLLSPFCVQVFVSLRPDQRHLPQFSHLTQLNDLPEYSNIGPLGGIFSAMTTYPQAAWLVLACDLPFADKDALSFLLANRQADKPATAFASCYDGLPEPLCAVWEPSIYVPALRMFKEEGIKCPRKILIKSDIHILQALDKPWLDNINTPEEFELVKSKINKNLP